MNDIKFGIPRRIWRLIYPVVLIIACASVASIPAMVVGRLPYTRYYEFLNKFWSVGFLIYLLTVIVLEMSAVVMPYIVIRKKMPKFKHENNIKLILLAIVCATACMFIITALLNIIPGANYRFVPFLPTARITNLTLAFWILDICVVGPIVEECVFRGMILSRAASWMPKWAAILISSTLFAVFHMNLAQATYAFFVGLVIGFLYIRYRTLLLPVVFHIAANSVSTIIAAVEQNTHSVPFFYAKTMSGALPILIPSAAALLVCFIVFMKLPKADPIAEPIQHKAEPIATPSLHTVESITAAQ